MTSNSISSKARNEAGTLSLNGKNSTTEISRNKEMIDRLFEDSKSILKNEYDNMVTKLKEDLGKSKERAIIKLKKL